MAKRRGSNKGRWHLWSTSEGTLIAPRPVERLPRGATISADGGWAELRNDKDVVIEVYVFYRPVPQLPRRERAVA